MLNNDVTILQALNFRILSFLMTIQSITSSLLRFKKVELLFSATREVRVVQRSNTPPTALILRDFKSVF